MTKSLMILIGFLLIGLGALSPLISNSSDPGKKTATETQNASGKTNGSPISQDSKLVNQEGSEAGEINKTEIASGNSSHSEDGKVSARRIDSIRVASLVLPCGGGFVLLACLFGSFKSDPSKFSTWLLTSALATGLVGVLMFILAVERANEISTNHAVLNLFLSAALCFLFVGFVGMVRLGSQPNETESASPS